MTSTLVLPTHVAPSNVRLPATATARYVDSDLYSIARRIQEISPTLNLWELSDDPTETHAWAITETCHDGWERLVFKVKELDGRVIEKLRNIMALTLEERIKRLDEEAHRFEAQEIEKAKDDLYERVGRPMWTDLERCGFIQRPVSYPKQGVTGGKGSRAKS